MTSGASGYSTNDVVLMAITAPVVLLNILAYLRPCLARIPPRRQLQDSIQSVWSCREKRKVDVYDALVEQRVNAKVKDNMVVGASYVCIAGNIFMATVAYNIVHRKSRWMTDGQTFSMLIPIALTTVATTCCRERMARFPRCLFIALMLSVSVVEVQVSGQLIAGIFIESGTFLFRFVPSTMYHKVCEVILWNVLVFIATVSAYAKAFEGQTELRFLILYQIWNCGVILSVSVSKARSVREQVRVDVETKDLRDESSGLSNLLDLVCDVVVVLDEDLRIKGNNSRFSAMVMLHGRSVEGVRLQDYMPSEEDKEAFERCTSLQSGSATEVGCVWWA